MILNLTNGLNKKTNSSVVIIIKLIHQGEERTADQRYSHSVLEVKI